MPPGNIAIYNSSDGTFELENLVERSHSHCAFEMVYFSDPASIENGLSVSKVRSSLGILGAELFKAKGYEVDAVSPVPETARTAAIACAKRLGATYAEDVIRKNRFYNKQRQFIQCSEQDRGCSLAQDPEKKDMHMSTKYLFDVWRAKERMLIVEDSIVRGNTLVGLLSEFIKRFPKTKEIHLLSTFPPVVSPCPNGIDMQTKGEFFIPYIICEQGIEATEQYALNKIREKINDSAGIVKSITYIPVNEYANIKGFKLENLCMGCCTGKYPNCTEEDLRKIGEQRNREKKHA